MLTAHDEALNENLDRAARAVAAAPAAQFASITYEAKGSGEVARHTLKIGVDLAAMYEDDAATVAALLETETDPLRIAAGEAILASLRESIDKGIGNNAAYTHGEAARGGVSTYEILRRGVKRHRETGALYVQGVTVAKLVVVEGQHKVVKSAALTLAKNDIRRILKTSKVREFCLTSAMSLRVNGETIEVV